MLLSLLAPIGPPVEPTEAEVAVGHERTHLELGGQRHRGAVVRRGRRRVRAGLMRDDLAQEAARPCLVPALGPMGMHDMSMAMMGHGPGNEDVRSVNPVVAESPGVGKGSTFTVRLPVLEDRAGSTPGAPADEGPRAAGSKRRILVVDDNRDAATSLAMLLRLRNNEVRTAHDGVEAAEVAQQRRGRPSEKVPAHDPVLQRALDVVTSLEIYQKR